ncbi:MAG: sulfotransferase [Anaerolineales bacterium]|nr:sulfotransferase [Anaerolineales bacterium]
MRPDWKGNGPIVIGGMGGSGTRLVAEILSQFGIFLGDDLNAASDNLLYTLLFRRSTWFYKSYQNKNRIETGLSVMEKLLLKEYGLSIQEIWFLLYAVTDTALHYRRDERSWSMIRLRKIINNPKFKDAQYIGWGWKEPNSYLILQDLIDHFKSLKFIHTIRHGADMAFSKNQRQLKTWGMLFGIPQPEIEHPRESLKFWARANQAVAEVGESLGANQYLQINYDLLCQKPQQIIDELITFLNLDVDMPTYKAVLKLPIIPPSMGRYKKEDLSQLDSEDLTVVESFGFTVEYIA